VLFSARFAFAQCEKHLAHLPNVLCFEIFAMQMWQISL
jgi:hypothetical protein